MQGGLPLVVAGLFIEGGIPNSAIDPELLKCELVDELLYLATAQLYLLVYISDKVGWRALHGNSPCGFDFLLLLTALKLNISATIYLQWSKTDIADPKWQTSFFRA